MINGLKQKASNLNSKQLTSRR